jgi:flavin-dependent dehydrogenase
MNLEKDFYDLVIVGAGPAGLTASLYAQRLGIEHIVIEKHTFPKDKICGDAIVPLAFRILEELNILPETDAFQRVNQMELKFTDANGSCSLINTYPSQLKVFNCKRISFDQYIFTKGDTKSHLLHAEARQVDPETNSIVVEENGNERRIGYKNLLLCTGSGKDIFLKSRENKLHSTSIASRAYIEVENAGDKNFIEFFEQVSPGYFWAFPVADNILNTGVLVHNNEHTSKLYQIHEQKLREYFQLKGDVDYTRWALKVYPNRETNTYHNIAIIGDANHSIDPVLGHGIDIAMLEAREQIFSIKNTGSITHTSPIYSEIKKRGELSLQLKESFRQNSSAAYKKEAFGKFLAETAKPYIAMGNHLSKNPVPWKNIEVKNDEMMASNTSLQNQLQHDGYAVVDMLNEKEFANLLELVGQFQFHFSNNRNREKLKYNNTFFESDIEQKKMFYQTMSNFLQPKVDLLMDNYDVLFANFWEKKPGDAEVIIHQNWTHVDESQHRSYTIWIPLQETSEVNGTMEVIPNSHYQFSTMRGLNMEYPLSYAFKSIVKEIKEEFLLPANLKPGQAIVFDDALIHYTGPNNSTNNRVAVQLVVKPKSVKGLFYYKHKEITTGNNVEVFEADADFYTRLQLITGANTRPQHGVSKGFVSHTQTDISIEDFRHRIKYGVPLQTKVEVAGQAGSVFDRVLNRVKNIF